MVVKGIIRNGRVEVSDQVVLPEGSYVEIVVLPRPEADTVIQDRHAGLRDLLQSFSGVCEGLPADLAEQHDHYIHGLPKR